MALAQGLYLIVNVIGIAEAQGLPPDAEGNNPRVITFSMQPNANRLPVVFSTALDRNLTTGLVTGDVVRIDLRADTTADQTAFETACPIGEHAIAS